MLWKTKPARPFARRFCGAEVLLLLCATTVLQLVPLTSLALQHDAPAHIPLQTHLQRSAEPSPECTSATHRRDEQAFRAPLQLSPRQQHSVAATQGTSEIRELPPAPRRSITSSAATWFVSSSGTNSTGCGQGPGKAACASLAAVLRKGASALEGSAVLVEPSTTPYDCPGTSLRANITIASSSPTTPAIFNCNNTKQWIHFEGQSNITSVVVQRMSLQNCYSNAAGGCMRAENVAHLSVIGCIFSACQSLQDGACISIKYNTSITGVQLLFDSVNISSAVSFSPTTSPVSGAISVLFNDATVGSVMRFSREFSCAHAYAILGKGGCVSVYYGGIAENNTIMFDGRTSMSDCRASDMGGCVSAYFSAEAQRSSLVFNGHTELTDCYARLGGGCISLYYENTVHHSSMTFRGTTSVSNCVARASGGGVSVFYRRAAFNTSLDVTGSGNFDSCAAGGNGGCVSIFHQYTANGAAVRFIGNITMAQCESGLTGGCISIIYMNNARDALLAFDGIVSVAHCLALRSGGGISLAYYDAVSNSSVKFSGKTSFAHCATGQSGGVFAVYTNGELDGQLVAFDGETSMTNCSANASGGCVSVYYYGNARSTALRYTGATVMRDCTAKQKGGCVSAYYSRNATDSAVTFRDEISFAGCHASENGGCVSLHAAGVTHKATITFYGTSTMNNCMAEANGGCVCATFDGDASSVLLRYMGTTTLSNCVAKTGVGGCVSVSYSAAAKNTTMAFEESLAVTRASAGNGGAISAISRRVVNGSLVSFSGRMSFSKCSATQRGGAVVVELRGIANDSALVFTGNTTMTQCSATLSGGGVYFEANGPSIDQNSIVFEGSTTMTGCSAAQGGCVCLLHTTQRIRSTNARMRGIVMRDTVAQIQGGSIACMFLSTDAQNVTASFQDVSITNSTAQLSSSFGGAISVQCTPGVPMTPKNPATTVAIWNHTCAVTMQNINIADARAGFGGGIDLQQGMYTLSNVWIARGAAESGGGGLRVSESASAELSNCTLASCSATSGSSSAIDMNSIGALSIVNSEIVPPEESGSVVLVRGASDVELRNTPLVCPQGYQYSNAEQNFTVALYPWVSFGKCCTQDSLQSSCIACPAQTYSLERGSNSLPDMPCLPVPYGAEARGGADIRARPGYWGAQYPTEREISMYLCPYKYCCPGPHSCLQVSYCSGNRDGILCGACKEGYSQLYSSSGCAPDSSCGQAYFYPIAVLIALVLALYYLYLPKSDASGMSTAVAGFYQILPLLLVSTSEESLIEKGIADVFNLQVPAAQESRHGSTGESMTDLCPIVGLGVVGKLFLHLLIPVLVAVLLGALCYVENFLVRRRVRPGRFALAVLRLVAFAYVSITKSTFPLLHCVPVMGEHRLFRAAEIKCYQPWQIALFFLVISLYAFPIFLFKQQRASRPTRFLPATCRDALARKYRHGLGYWDAVLLSKRLVFVSVYVFVADVYWRLMVLTVLCTIALIIHLLVAPYKVRYVNWVEAAFLSEIAMIALINLRNAVFVSASVFPEGRSAEVTEQLRKVQSALVFLPAIVMAAYYARKYGRRVVACVQEICAPKTNPGDDKDVYVSFDDPKRELNERLTEL